MFGYSIGISDVRVTLKDGSERDCLQKLHSVGPFIVAGFSGSVKDGFAMIDALRVELGGIPSDQAWDPTAVAEWWPSVARYTFAQFDTEFQRRGCDLMLLCSSKSVKWSFPAGLCTHLSVAKL